MRHGESDMEFPTEVWLGPDPDLAFVHADMAAWMEAHPCICDDDCACDDDCECECAG